MDARQRRSKSVLTTLHERAGSLPLSARPEVFDQRYGSANYNVKSNQITFIVTSSQHMCLAEWNSWERAPYSAETINI